MDMDDLLREVKQINERTARMDERILQMNDTIKQLQSGQSNFVTRQEFELKVTPIQNLVYGAAGVILLAVITAVVALVVT